jgi:DNA-binding NarL/FixJ family response regulator
MSPDALRKRIKVLLADQHSLFRQAVAEIVDREHDLEVVAEARGQGEAVREARRTRPDVAILAAELSDGDGLRALRAITEEIPECRVVVLTDQEDQDLLVQAVEVGAVGYLTKECALSDLITATRAVHRGDTLVPPGMLGDLLRSLIWRNKHEKEAIRRISQLTRREQQVLALLAEGANKNTIARRLVISPETARTHIQNVLAKLGVHSRLEAATFALQGGVLHDMSTSER